LSRFERQTTEGGDLPALLGSATEEFRRSLERHVQQIVEAAKEQAAEIERDAHRSAKQREQQLDVRSQELVQGVVTRAASVLDSIELVQTAISGMLAELRAEVKALESGASGASQPVEPAGRPPALLGSDQRLAREAPAQKSQAQVSPPQAPPSRAAAPAQPAPAAPATEAARGTQSPATSEQAAKPQPQGAAPTTQTQQAQQPPAKTEEQQPTKQAEPGPLVEQAPAETKAGTSRADSSAEFDQMIHGEIRRMFQSGKSRQDVESFLARFELGDNYLGLLDELYSQKDPSGRRRIFGRRRER
jgi:hypothetical protein